MSAPAVHRTGPTRRRRRRGGAMVAAGLLCAAAALFGATSTGAQEAQELFSFDLRAGGRGYSTFYDAPDQGRTGEATVPEASSSLTNGPIGYGLASIAWPGPIIANGGTLFVGLGGPPQAQMFDSPVRAEARTPQDPPTTTNDDVPGAHMEATATGELVESVAQVDRSAADPGTFGPSEARSGTALEGGSGTAQATSLVQDIVLAEGVVKIESVSSAAQAATDGTAADGSATTTVQGLTIARQPATVDENGLRFGEQGAPANAIANQIAQQALSQAGITIVLSAPTKEVDGATAKVTAGSLIVTWESEGGLMGVKLGGAEASVTGTLGFDDLLDDLTSVDLGDTGSGDTFTDLGDPGGIDVGDTGASFDPGPTDVVTDAPAEPADTAPPQVALPAVPASAEHTPVRPAVAALGVLAAGLVGFGMRRLSTDVLAENAGTTCPLAEG